MITIPIMGDFLLAQRGSDIPIPKTPAQGSLANTSSEEPQNTPLGRHIAFEIPSPAPCFAEEEEEEEDDDDDDDEEGGAKIWREGEEEEDHGRGGGLEETQDTLAMLTYTLPSHVPSSSVHSSTPSHNWTRNLERQAPHGL